MLKKLSHVFLLSAVLSLAVYVLLFSFSSSRTICLRPCGRDGLLDVLQQQVDMFWREGIENQITKGAVTLVHTTLGSCPETPPGLVGPLRVEFDFNRTWHDVRKELSLSLQRGGRYKPRNCISNHKVGNFLTKRPIDRRNYCNNVCLCYVIYAAFMFMRQFLFRSVKENVYNMF